MNDEGTRDPFTRTRTTDRGWHRLVRENWYRDLWLFAITVLVFLALVGFGPLGIKGIDDIARDGRETADAAKTAADEAKAATARNRELLASQRITRADIRRIAREQAKPSVGQILKLIKRATEVCTANPAACRQIGSATGSSQSSGPGSSTSPAPASGRPTRIGNRSPKTRRPPPRRGGSGGGGRPPPPSQGGPPPSGGGGPAQPPPVADVHTPNTVLPKHPVCIDNLVRVDCP